LRKRRLPFYHQPGHLRAIYVKKKIMADILKEVTLNISITGPTPHTHGKG
jgi:hypothetical protein